MNLKTKYSVKLRLYNSFKMFYWTLKYPILMNPKNFEMLSDLLKMILQTAEEQKPRMTKVGMVSVENEHKDIVAVWAGPAITSNPYDRISDLKKENEDLRIQISMLRQCI